MGLAELALVAVGLSMDAFAVAVCKGLGMRRLDLRQACIVAAFFGGFQALMPLAGWVLGEQFSRFVAPVAHWVAFALLCLIGAKMVWDAFHEEEPGEGAGEVALDLRELALLAVATSIDAFVVGVTFAFLRVDIVKAAAFIGSVTFVLSLAGVAVGHQFGSRWNKPSTVAGGVVLIVLGVKTLIEHLM